ncbi:MAG: hypothetical protein ABL901_01135 [Hyphomicrobiaceae bacterium]
MILASQRRIGAFRMRTPKKAKKSAADKRPGMSRTHCEAIRLLPCCCCGRMPGGTIHHLKQGTGERGAGMRASDKWGVPLCAPEHEDLERQGSRNEMAWFAARGIASTLDLAVALWTASPDTARMTKIVIQHRGKR